ncbi:MAG: carbohydrate ABC transporter permease [Eubacteriales bacterium]|nr:carbohydrate ABC transporter permease [Eubacteriales bacterium]
MADLVNETAYKIKAPVKKVNRIKLSQVLIHFILITYCIITILPFYFLAVRSFVPTTESAVLHVWLPKSKDVSMNSVIGNLSTYYNLDMKAFKNEMEIKGYLDPQLTLEEISERYSIPQEKLQGYFESFYLINGWRIILSGGQFLKATLRTVFIVVSSILIGALLSLATGSVLARFRKKWHMYVYNLYMLQTIIPITMIMLPLYLIVTKILHLENSLASIVLLNIQGSALSTMIFTAYASTIPVELQESLEIDGGNRFNYFFKIVVPLSKVVIATYAVIRIPAYWNDLLYGFLFLKNDSYPLVPMLSSLSGTYNTNFQAIYSGLLFSIAPLVVLYLLFQDLFVKSIMSGSIKG